MEEKIKKGSAPELFKHMKDNYVDLKAAEKMTEEQLVGKKLMGEFANKQEPEYTELYQQLIDRAQA